MKCKTKNLIKITNQKPQKSVPFYFTPERLIINFIVVGKIFKTAELQRNSAVCIFRKEIDEDSNGK